MQQQPIRADNRSPKSAAPEPDGLPNGVTLRPLPVYADERGSVTELFSCNQPTGIVPAQWVMTVSAAGVMRGVHVHARHDDYFALIDGRIVLGLHDLRAGSPTAGRAATVELAGEQPSGVFIPHGVAHGFLFLRASTFVLASSHPYDVDDELGCHWLDPELGLNWPTTTAQLSARDAALPPLREVAKRIPRWSAG